MLLAYAQRIATIGVYLAVLQSLSIYRLLSLASIDFFSRMLLQHHERLL